MCQQRTDTLTKLSMNLSAPPTPLLPCRHLSPRFPHFPSCLHGLRFILQSLSSPPSIFPTSPYLVSVFLHKSLSNFSLPVVPQLSLQSPLSLDQAFSPVIIDLEWHDAEPKAAVLVGRSLCTDVKRQLPTTESTAACRGSLN